MAQIDLLDYVSLQLKTGIQLAHELENSGRMDPHDVSQHITDFVKVAHAKIDEIAVICRLALEQESKS